MGNYKFNLLVNSDSNRNITTEFTSVNTKSYLMKISLMSNSEKEDKEYVKQMLSLGL
jgi:hypothetical protein